MHLYSMVFPHTYLRVRMHAGNRGLSRAYPLPNTVLGTRHKKGWNRQGLVFLELTFTGREIDDEIQQ